MSHAYISTSSKKILILPFAAFTTAALLMLMASLISTDFVVDPIQSTRIKSAILPAEREIKEQPKEIKAPETPAPAPATVAPITKNKLLLIGTTITIPVVTPNEGVTINPAFQEGEPVPYIRPAPIYPSRPLSKGTEGFVDLQFAITAAGATDAITVTYGQPEGTFDRAAIRAVQKWKYKPQISGGQAIRKEGVRTRVSFKISD